MPIEDEPRVVSAGFHGRVYAVVRGVPPGRVTTYGAVGAALGSARVARQVGWALAALRDDSVPWHRVLDARGRISDRGDADRAALQRALLLAEGVVFTGDRVDLATFRHPLPPTAADAPPPAS